MFTVKFGALKGSWPTAFVARKNIGKFTGGWRLVRIRGPDCSIPYIKTSF